MVDLLQDELQFLERGANLADDWIVTGHVQCLEYLDEGGCCLHENEGFLVLLSLDNLITTSTPFSITYLAQEISSCGMAYFF